MTSPFDTVNKTTSELLQKVQQLEANLQRAIEALRFYADSNQWDWPGYDEGPTICDDAGKKAIEALKELGAHDSNK